MVLGHSLGEIAAAHTAGVYSLEDGLRLAAARGALIGALPGEGAMAAVFAPASRVSEALDEHNAASQGMGLCIAADNGAHQVISGPAAEIAAILERLEASGIRVARLRRSPAYHSVMDRAGDGRPGGSPLAALLRAAVAPLREQSHRADDRFGRKRWTQRTGRRQMRAPVEFRACVETLSGLGVDAVVEIGPHAVLGADDLAFLAGLGRSRRAGGGVEPPAAGNRRRAAGPGVRRRLRGGRRRRLRGGVAATLRRASSPARRGAASRSPVYPFQRERYWVESPKRRRPGTGQPVAGGAA